MKTKLLLSFTVLTALSCKHDLSRDDSRMLAVDSDWKSNDAALIHEDLVNASSECRNPLVNLIVSSMTDGLLRNSAVSDLGVENPVGKAMKTDSVYFQILRIASIFDYELAQGIQDSKITPCLPQSFGVQIGSFSKDYLKTLPSAFPEDSKKLREVALLIKSDLGEFQIKSSRDHETVAAWPKTSSYPEALQKALRLGVAEKIDQSAKRRNQNDDLGQKLEGMATTFAPLYIAMNSNFARESTKTYIEAYIPPLYELENAESENLADWKMTEGIKRRALPRPADISVAKLTHIAYLQNPDPKDKPLIKVQLFRDLKDPNRLKSRIFFGKWDDQAQEKGVLGIDVRDYRNAFVVAFHPFAAIKDGDNAILKKAKEELNAVTSVYKIDARIHRLAIDLVRNAADAKTKASAMSFHPKFSMKDSDISFRLNQTVDLGRDRDVLIKLGFNCDQIEGAKRVCYRDFGVYSELRDFFLRGEDPKPEDNNLLTRIGNKFRETVNQLIAFNVKMVIDWNMKVIESAIDDQFDAILSDLVNQQADLHKKVNERLESRLFNKD